MKAVFLSIFLLGNMGDLEPQRSLKQCAIEMEAYNTKTAGHLKGTGYEDADIYWDCLIYEMPVLTH